MDNEMEPQKTMQQMFDEMMALSKASMLSDKGGMSLAELVDALGGLLPEDQVGMEVGEHIFIWGDVGSYRGYYEDLALEPAGRGYVRSGDIYVRLHDAVEGEVFEGYKGGGYRMGPDTVVWVSPYGEYWGALVTGLEQRDDKWIITTVKVK